MIPKSQMYLALLLHSILSPPCYSPSCSLSCFLKRKKKKYLLLKMNYDKQKCLSAQTVSDDSIHAEGHLLLLFLYKAVPFFGRKKGSIFTCSSVSSATFFCKPPEYPVRLPLLPTTRWQGQKIEMGLCPTAPPTARAETRPSPLFSAIRRAIFP